MRGKVEEFDRILREMALKRAQIIKMLNSTELKKIDLFRLLSPMQYAPPDTEYVSLHSKALRKII